MASNHSFIENPGIRTFPGFFWDNMASNHSFIENPGIRTFPGFFCDKYNQIIINGLRKKLVS